MSAICSEKKNCPPVPRVNVTRHEKVPDTLDTRKASSDDNRRLRKMKKEKRKNDKKLWALSVHHSAGSSRRLAIPLNQTVCIAL